MAAPPQEAQRIGLQVGRRLFRRLCLGAGGVRLIGNHQQNLLGLIDRDIAEGLSRERLTHPAPLINEPTYVRAKRAIIGDLVAGLFKPGDQLTIEMLTSRYCVSHMPIREALRQLEGEGVLVSLAHRGFRFKSVAPAYIAHIYDVRVGIESMLARRAVEKATADQIAEVVSIHEGFSLAIGRNDFVSANAINKQFHQTLYSIADNPEAMEILEGRTRVVRTLGDSVVPYASETFDCRVAEHSRIVEALVGHEPEACGQAVFDHVTAARDRLLKYMHEAGGASVWHEEPVVGAARYPIGNSKAGTGNS